MADKDNICTHVNVHILGEKGKPVNLRCEKEAGHLGLHGAKYHHVVKQFGGMVSTEEVEKYELVEDEEGNTFYEADLFVEWSDLAGTPTKDIKPVSPGQHLVNADHMFPEAQNQKMEDMRAEIEELRKLVLKGK